MNEKELNKILVDSKAESLIKNYETPFFIFFPKIMKKKIDQLNISLKKNYPNSQITYSVKTNYLPYVIKKAHSFGAYPECISGFEILIIKKLNLLNKNVVINGPLKSEDDLIKISKLGCKINIDNFTELEIVQKVAKKLNLILEIGIRIYTKLEKKTWSRFGFNLDNQEAIKVAKKIKNKMPNLKLVGLHTHIGTNLINLKIYQSASKKISEFGRLLEKENLIKLKYLDLGGGFATNLPFKDYKKKVWIVPKANDYIKAIVNPIKKIFKKKITKINFRTGKIFS